jgi:HEAT repeat protein
LVIRCTKISVRHVTVKHVTVKHVTVKHVTVEAAGNAHQLQSMNIHDIATDLTHPDYQYRLKAIAALKAHPPEQAMPMLLAHTNDTEFLVRTFVARGFGQQQTAEAFAGLLPMLKLDNTPSVRAEAANSLSLFGCIAVSHLVQAFIQDDHWLVQRSILAALMDMNYPEALYEVCLHGLGVEDLPVRESSVDALGTLAGSTQQADALAQLLILSQAQSDRIRQHVARALKQFDHPDAKAALIRLRQDPNHQVVGAALEELFDQ